MLIPPNIKVVFFLLSYTFLETPSRHTQMYFQGDAKYHQVDNEAHPSNPEHYTW